MKITIFLSLLIPFAVFSQTKKDKLLTADQIDQIRQQTFNYVNDTREEIGLPPYHLDRSVTLNAQRVSEELLTRELMEEEIPIICGTRMMYWTFREIKINTEDSSRNYISNNDYLFMGITGSPDGWKPTKDSRYALGIGVSEYPDRPGVITLVIFALKDSDSD